MNELEQSNLSELLQRAQEIERQTGLLTDEDRQILSAAEEAGLSRDATIQALRERINSSQELFEEGKLVFAKSADNHFYAARLTSIKGGNAAVRFLGSGDATVSLHDLRPFSMVPGTRMQFFIPSYGMWVEGQVTQYNSETLSVSLNYWGQQQSCPVDKIRLAAERKMEVWGNNSKLWAIGIASGLAGTAFGMLLMKLLGH